MHTTPRYIHIIFEVAKDVPPEREQRARIAFTEAGSKLEKEWGVTIPISVYASIETDKDFRDEATSGPQSWKYCFLLRDQIDNRVHCNVDIFHVLSSDAEKMITHEIAHIVIAQLVGDIATYRKSYFLEEGTAGFDGATERLRAKIIKEQIQDIPDPFSIQTMDDVRRLGGDTNKEPFIDQLGYLVFFSAIEFLRERQGEAKILETYRTITDECSLEDAYASVCGESLRSALGEWRAELCSDMVVGS